MEISAALVKRLREKTGAGMMDCKKALQDTNGDEQAAIDLLRKKGAASAEKRSGRQTGEGVIFSYIHPGDKLGVLVEVNCETDFVARNQSFKDFVKDIAMHIAASNPLAIDREHVDQKIIERERRIYTEQMEEIDKPASMKEKIVENKVEKFYQENCLMEQPFIRDTNQSVKEYLTDARAKIGENIVIRRYVRFQLGEEIE